MFYSLTNILCKHLCYNQARVEQIRTISPSFNCQFLLRCQSIVKLYRHAETVIHESMCLAGYPEKHTPRLYPRHKQDQPVPLLSRVSRSPSKLGLLAPALEAGLNAVLRPPPIPASNQSVRKEPEPTTRE
jgi:hypothetical protein